MGAFFMFEPPVILVVAHGFHLVFERSFMSSPSPKTEREAEVAISPAP